jgi:hypothetical protein
MGPAQFRTQSVANWEILVEDPHMPQIRDVEPSPELYGERRSHGLQQLTPIFRPRRSTLLKLYNLSTDFPAGLHLNGIDGSQSLLPGRLNQVAKVSEQERGALVSNHRVGQIFLVQAFVLIVPLLSAKSVCTQDA